MNGHGGPRAGCGRKAGEGRSGAMYGGPAIAPYRDERLMRDDAIQGSAALKAAIERMLARRVVEA